MSKLEMKTGRIWLTTIIAGIVIILIESVIKGASDGTFLFTLTFWVAVIQGPIALVAAAEISEGKWINPLKRDLLAFYPLILLLAFLFIFFRFQTEIYVWAKHPGKWLNENFFVIRNVLLLVLSFALAWLYVRSSLADSKRKGFFAVLFLLSFVMIQSIVAIEWVMSLDYPWISTMFPPLFFIESFYAGLALAAIISGFLVLKGVEKKGSMAKFMQDAALFMFGFALAWAGLYYGQYLVIWYGNIPWETSYFGTRMSHSPFREMMYLTILILFIIPFVGLLGKQAKKTTPLVIGISFLVLIGVVIERIFYIHPVVPINFLWVLIEFALMSFLFLIYYRNREKILAATAVKK